MVQWPRLWGLYHFAADTFLLNRAFRDFLWGAKNGMMSGAFTVASDHGVMFVCLLQHIDDDWGCQCPKCVMQLLTVLLV